MRPPSLSCTWCNEMSWSSVALYTFTGTLTSPKVMAPFQMDLMRQSLPQTSHLSAFSGQHGGMASTDQYVNIDGNRLKLTSLDKVLYPETGTTKADVLD